LFQTVALTPVVRLGHVFRGKFFFLASMRIYISYSLIDFQSKFQNIPGKEEMGGKKKKAEKKGAAGKREDKKKYYCR